MLVLSRQKGETIEVTVGTVHIVITTASIQGNRVRLGIEASREAVIRRGEVADKMRANGELEAVDA